MAMLTEYPVCDETEFDLLADEYVARYERGEDVSFGPTEFADDAGDLAGAAALGLVMLGARG
jgi:hypothetical protein